MNTIASRQLTPISKGIIEYLSDNYFEVPHNQREYRWQKDQLYQLWLDIIEITEEAPIGPRGATGHFLGAVVVIGGDNSDPSNRLKIIDGQQRLTTISIFASCLIGFAKEISDKNKRKLAEGALESAIISYAANGALRLKLNKCNDFLSALLQCDNFGEREQYIENNIRNGSEIERNIADSFIFFQERLLEFKANFSDAEQISEGFQRLVSALVEGLYILSVRTSNLEMAYKLFETLNARGLDLSQADLIKNVLLERSVGTEEGAIVECWNKVSDNYETQSHRKLELPQIIQFSYSYRYESVKKDKIFDFISEKLYRGDATALELANNFVSDSSLWLDFLQVNIDSWSDKVKLVEAHSAILYPLWKEHCVPFLMAMMDRFSDDLDSLEKCAVACEKYLFRQGVVSKDSAGNLQKTFTSAARLLKSQAEIDDVISLFRRYSPDAVFIENFKTLSFANVKQSLYTLQKIECFISGAPLSTTIHGYGEVNYVEHIMPRRTSDAWGDIQSNDRFGLFLNRLGNLLIIDSKLSNSEKIHSFSSKVEEFYSTSSLALPKEINTNSWNFESIEKRQASLVNDYALEIWGY